MVHSNELCSESDSSGPREDALDDEDDDDPQSIKYVHRRLWCISSDPLSSDVESLRRGIIGTSKDKVQAPYTILLVGETGVGKSSVLELIANVLVGKDVDNYDFNILDHANEQHGSDHQSQTNSARLYPLMSNNGRVVSIYIYGD